MSLIIFNTRHALLLSGLRFLRPRSNRGEGAEWPRNFIDLSPQTRRIQGREQVALQTRTRAARVRGQSTATFPPGTRTVQRRDHGLAFAADTNFPQTGTDLRLPKSAFPSTAKSIRVAQNATKFPYLGISMFNSLGIQSPSPSQLIPSYALI
jgi:hypothetical protein